MEIGVTSGALATLREEAARVTPSEACGLLLGRGETISEARPAANVHPAPATHFEIDPAALIAAHRAAREGGLQVLGYYHSHPTGDPAPSLEDRAQASGDGRIWAIVADGTIGWWHDGPQGFEALPSRVVDG
jgi:proteasome lid subunit RPN8/RPN11